MRIILLALQIEVKPGVDTNRAQIRNPFVPSGFERTAVVFEVPTLENKLARFRTELGHSCRRTWSLSITTRLRLVRER